MISNRVRHFLAVARTGGFGKAAAMLGIAQAPLSQSVQRLERELGVTLFERTAKGVVLTDAGRAMLPEAEIALAASDRARVVARSVGISTAPVRLGVITPSLWGALPTLLTLAASTDVRVELAEGTTEELLEDLYSGRLDVSFVAPPFPRREPLKVIDLFQDRLLAAMPESMAPPKGDFADLAVMSDALILFPRRYGPALHSQLLTLFEGQGLGPKVVFESPRMLTTLALVSAGVGSSVVSPSLAKALSVTNVAYREFAPALAAPVWPISIAYLPPVDGTAAHRLMRRIERLAASGNL